jgi:hypothetical protein
MTPLISYSSGFIGTQETAWGHFTKLRRITEKAETAKRGLIQSIISTAPVSARLSPHSPNPRYRRQHQISQQRQRWSHIVRCGWGKKR